MHTACRLSSGLRSLRPKKSCARAASVSGLHARSSSESAGDSQAMPRGRAAKKITHSRTKRQQGESAVTEWAIGIDIGGTFTDVVALDYAAGRLHGLKVLTTHGDPAEGVSDGVRRLIKAYGIDPAAVRRVVHATTLFANALIERNGIRTGLLINEGFKDVIEIGHERKYDLYDLAIERAPALVCLLYTSP